MHASVLHGCTYPRFGVSCALYQEVRGVTDLETNANRFGSASVGQRATRTHGRRIRILSAAVTRSEPDLQTLQPASGSGTRERLSACDYKAFDVITKSDAATECESDLRAFACKQVT